MINVLIFLVLVGLPLSVWAFGRSNTHASNVIREAEADVQAWRSGR